MGAIDRMKSTVEQIIREAIRVLQQSGTILPEVPIEIQVFMTKNVRHGDYATNIALHLAKFASLPSMKLAAVLVQMLSPSPLIERIEIAEPGFINFFIKKIDRLQIIPMVLTQGGAFGNPPDALQQAVSSEFVSGHLVYSIQYAHARISGLFRQLQACDSFWNERVGEVSLHLLVCPHEAVLVFLLNRYPEVVKAAGRPIDRDLIANYLHELAKGLHSYYNAVPLLCEPVELRQARLILLKAVRQVLKNGVQLLGVSAPESM